MISIILPTYNEKDNVKNLVHSIKKNLLGTKHEIIIVDDNSPDGTYDIAKKIAKKDASVRAIVRKKKRGLALSIKEGISISKGDILIFMDSDLSHPPRYIPTLIKEISGNDIVIASRFIKGGKMIYGNGIQVLASKSINFFVRSMLGLKIKDVTGGFFAMRRSVLGRIDLDKIFNFYGDYFFRLMHCLKNEGLKIKEVPFTYEPRVTGVSKTRLLRVGFLYIREVFKILAGI